MWFPCSGLFLTLFFSVEWCQATVGQDAADFGSWVLLWTHRCRPPAWSQAAACPQRKAVTLRTLEPYVCEMSCAIPGPLDASLPGQDSGWSNADCLHFPDRQALSEGLVLRGPDSPSELGLLRHLESCSCPRVTPAAPTPSWLGGPLIWLMLFLFPHFSRYSLHIAFLLKFMLSVLGIFFFFMCLQRFFFNGD